MGRGLSRRAQRSCSGIDDFASINLVTHTAVQGRPATSTRAERLLHLQGLPDRMGSRLGFWEERLTICRGKAGLSHSVEVGLYVVFIAPFFPRSIQLAGIVNWSSVPRS
jgi:hypothetical protein